MDNRTHIFLIVAFFMLAVFLRVTRPDCIEYRIFGGVDICVKWEKE